MTTLLDLNLATMPIHIKQAQFIMHFSLHLYLPQEVFVFYLPQEVFVLTCLLFRCPVMARYSSHDLKKELKVCYSSHQSLSLSVKNPIT